MQNYFGAMLRYFEFSGRSTRREYWWYGLGALLAIICGFCIDYYVLGYYHAKGSIGPFFLFAIFIHIVPNLTVMVRRLHDAGKSGWWYWICLVPFIGGLWLFYLTAIKGPDDDSDDFGPDPRYESEGTSFRFTREPPVSRAQLLMQQMEEQRRRRMST